MRRVVISFVAVFVGAFAWAKMPAEELIANMAAYFRSLGRYEVSFAIKTQEFDATGEYAVEGDLYYMRVFHTEVYSDGKVRYEVDNERREINIDMVNLTSRNILDNPTRCFDFVGSSFSSEIVKGGTETVVVLSSEEIGGKIEVKVNSANAVPLAVTYFVGNEEVDVEIKSIKKLATPVKRFVQSNYKEYEIVDFR